MTLSDLETLRSYGFEDKELLTIVASASFENFLGRVAAGLGVKLEAETKACPRDGISPSRGPLRPSSLEQEL